MWRDDTIVRANPLVTGHRRRRRAAVIGYPRMHIDVRPLGPGDVAPDFALPAADGDHTLRLADYRARGPVLLTVMRGLYCPFCRRHLTQLGELSGRLGAAGVAVLGIVVAPVDRARLYFRFRPARFPIAVDPNRSTHRAYGLPAFERTPEVGQAVESAAREFARALNIRTTSDRVANEVNFDGFVPAASDIAEKQASLQMSGHFLVDRDGVIRWAYVEEPTSLALPSPEELSKLPERIGRAPRR